MKRGLAAGISLLFLVFGAFFSVSPATATDESRPILLVEANPSEAEQSQKDETKATTQDATIEESGEKKTPSDEPPELPVHGDTDYVVPEEEVNPNSGHEYNLHEDDWNPEGGHDYVLPEEELDSEGSDTHTPPVESEPNATVTLPDSE